MKTLFILLFLATIGAFLRFYNLNWGSPFYFHPDERNITNLVLSTSLNNPATLLKGAFAYGNFPVILTLILKTLLVPFLAFLKITDPFAQTTIVLRVISAFFSALICLIIYKSGKFWSEKVAYLSLFLSVFSIGFIQQAHFGTFDGFIAFCSIIVFYFLLCFLNSKKISFFYFTFLFISIGSASKINLILLAIFPLLLLFFINKNAKKHWKKIIIHSLAGILLLFSLTILLSPYYLTVDFKNALIYERGVVTGTLPVFYTQSFFNTLPVAFQFLHIYPFLLNPFITFLFIPSFFYVSWIGIKKKNHILLILNSIFLILFLPQAFLFAKWTRYMIPTLPFIYLIIAIALVDFISLIKSRIIKNYLILFPLIIGAIIFVLSYFKTAFLNVDTRVNASYNAAQTINSNNNIISEVYDLGIVPFNSYFPNITLFNFYDLDTNPNAYRQLQSMLTQAKYIILPSQRLLKTRIRNKQQFPNGNMFYTSLLNGTLGFEKIYETPCDIFCKITYMSNPVFAYEETASVFERPEVFIFRKKHNL